MAKQPKDPALGDTPESDASEPTAQSVDDRLSVLEAGLASLQDQFEEIFSTSKPPSAHALAATESEGDTGDADVVCKRCGAAFTENEIEEGVNCTHNKCPMTV